MQSLPICPHRMVRTFWPSGSAPSSATGSTSWWPTPASPRRRASRTPRWRTSPRWWPSSPPTMRAGSPATPSASTAAPSSEAASVQEIDAMNPASSRRRDQYGTSADQTLLDQYLRLRQHTQTLVAPLNHEDMAGQALPHRHPRQNRSAPNHPRLPSALGFPH